MKVLKYDALRKPLGNRPAEPWTVLDHDGRRIGDFATLSEAAAHLEPGFLCVRPREISGFPGVRP